jgi:hypothetical protein
MVVRGSRARLVGSKAIDILWSMSLDIGPDQNMTITIFAVLDETFRLISVSLRAIFDKFPMRFTHSPLFIEILF